MGPLKNIIPGWERLQKIRRLNIYAFAKWASISTPIIASFVAFVDKYTPFKLNIPIDITIVYVAAFLFIAASVIVDICCPDLIKDHHSFNNFFQFISDRVKTVSEIERRLAEKQDDLLRQLTNEIATRVGTEYNDDKIRELFRKLVAEETSSAFLDGARQDWSQNDSSFSPMRCVAACAYATAAVLALYVSLVDTPLKVFNAAV